MALAFLPVGLSAQQGQQAALVEVTPAVTRNLAGSLTLVGTVHPARRAVLGSAVDGRLEVIVDDGVWVERGKPIAQLRTGTINIELQGAIEELALREHELDELKAGSREEEKRVARAKLESAKALAEYHKARYERTKALFPRQAASQEEVEQALSAYVAAEKTQAAAEAEYELALNGPRVEKILQAEDRMRMQTETVNHLKDRRDKFWIRPYFHGYVTTKFAEVGAWVRQGDPLVEVIELDPVEITVNVAEAHIARVRQGMEAQVRIDGVSTREAWTGRVVRIIPQADLKSRTFAVKVSLANQEVSDAAEPAAALPVRTASVETKLPEGVEELEVQPGELKDHRFKAGMLAHVTMRLGAKQDATLVPKDALVLGGSSLGGQPSYSIFVARSQDGKNYVAQAVPVAIGMYDNDWVEVASQVPNDLRAGDLVVTLGNERLRPGQAIRFSLPKK